MTVFSFTLKIIKSWRFIFALVLLYFAVAWFYLKNSASDVSGSNLAVIVAIPLVCLSAIWVIKRAMSKNSNKSTEQESTSSKASKNKTKEDFWLYALHANTLSALGETSLEIIEQAKQGFTPKVDNTLIHPLYMSPALSLRLDIDAFDQLSIQEDENLNFLEDIYKNPESTPQNTLTPSARAVRLMLIFQQAINNAEHSLLALQPALNSDSTSTIITNDAAVLHHEWVGEKQQEVIEEQIKSTNKISLLTNLNIANFLPADLDSESQQWIKDRLFNLLETLGFESNQLSYQLHEVGSADDTISALINTMKELYDKSEPSIYLFLGADTHVDQDWLDAYMTSEIFTVGEIGAVFILSNQSLVNSLSKDDEIHENISSIIDTKLTLPKITKRQKPLRPSIKTSAEALISSLTDTEYRYHNSLAYLADSNTKTTPEVQVTDSDKTSDLVYYLTDISKSEQPAQISEFQTFQESKLAIKNDSETYAYEWQSMGELAASCRSFSPLVTISMAITCPREAGFTNVFLHSGDYCRSTLVVQDAS